MAFFTRQGLSVPEIPTNSASTEELAQIPSCSSTDAHFLETSSVNTIKYNTHIPLSLKNSACSGNSSDNGLSDVRGVEV